MGWTFLCSWSRHFLPNGVLLPLPTTKDWVSVYWGPLACLAFSTSSRGSLVSSCSNPALVDYLGLLQYCEHVNVPCQVNDSATRQWPDGGKAKASTMKTSVYH